jgi:hypothetical protein
MEQVTRYDHGIRLRRNDPVHRSTKGTGNVGFPLVNAACSLPVILPDSEVRIGDVGEFHGLRMCRKEAKSKKWRARRGVR